MAELLDECCRCHEAIGSRAKLGRYTVLSGVGMGSEPGFEPQDMLCWSCYCQWREEQGCPVPTRMLDEGAEGALRRLIKKTTQEMRNG